MRTKRTHQMSIYETFAEHEIGQELKAISGWLDLNVNVLDWAESDIQRTGIKNTGRSGMSIESILRCGLLKQHQQWTYEDLAFHLADSATSAAFARLPRGLYPTDPALQGAIALISGQTRERISHALVKDALSNRLETLKQARIDSTVTETLIRKPWDSQLLGDAERVLERLMIEACEHNPQLRHTRHRQSRQRVRAAHRHHRQRPARHPVWAQAQSDHGQTRHGIGCGD